MSFLRHSCWATKKNLAIQNKEDPGLLSPTATQRAAPTFGVQLNMGLEKYVGSTRQGCSFSTNWSGPARSLQRSARESSLTIPFAVLGVRRQGVRRGLKRLSYKSSSIDSTSMRLDCESDKLRRIEISAVERGT